MKRLARHLFTLCSAMSLLLCLALCVLWARSHWVQDVVGLSGTGEAGRTSYVLASAGGRVGVERQVRLAGPAGAPRHMAYAANGGAGAPYMVAGWGTAGGFWRRFGFASAARSFTAPPFEFPGHRWVGVAPYSVPCAALAVMPALWVARRKGRAPNHRLMLRATGIGFVTMVVTGSLMDANVAPAEWGWQLHEWVLALLVGAGVGTMWWRRAHLRALHRGRMQHGLCPSCGYDLRASPDRCPECGAAGDNGQMHVSGSPRDAEASSMERG